MAVAHPALGRYRGRVKEVPHRSHGRPAGLAAGEPDLRRDPETTALRARVQTGTGSVVEVRVESSARITCVTVDDG